MNTNAKDLEDLANWIESLVPVVKARPLLTEEPEVADALVLVATSVVCETCQEHHVSSSHVMRRVPRKNGTVFYKPIIGPNDLQGLPHVTEWAFETVSQCWKCWDIAERLIDPLANLAMAPDKLEFVPAPVDKEKQREPK